MPPFRSDQKDMRETLIAGNWKMNGSNQSVVALVDGICAGNQGDANLAIFPPSIFLGDVGRMLEGSDVALGSQNVCDQANGAFTGEVSAEMLKSAGCYYAIVGHSERRSLYYESDELIAARFMQAKSSELVPILCVGETLDERESGITERVISRQIDAVITQYGISALSGSVIAYEPVWAIGTGKVATPEQAQSVHTFIRHELAKLDQVIAEKIQILYGGSMNPGNARELLSQQDIDGGLIGGASLKADDFLAIAQSA